jgi:hypothetical protein
MAEVDRLRTAKWFQSLDPNVQQAFQRIADKQPALVVEALSNGTVEAPAEGAVSLDQFFAMSGEDSWKPVSPEYLVRDAVCSPEHPDPGVAFTVTYTVWNSGTNASAPRRDIVRIYADDGTTVVAEQPVDGKPLAQNEQEQLTATFAQGVTEGLRYPQILANLDGTPYGAAANEHGHQAYTNGPNLEVGVYAGSVGPATAGMTYFGDIRVAAESLNLASQYSDSYAIPHLRRGLTSLSTAVAAAVAELELDSLADIASSIKENAESVDTYVNEEALRREWPEAMPEAIVTLYTAVVPLQTLRYEADTIARYLPPVRDPVNWVVRLLLSVY